MLQVEEALEQILSRVTPLGVEHVELMSSLGRVLAEPIASTRDIPPWSNSSMDGYAVRAADSGHGVALRVVAHVAAGAPPTAMIGPGEAARIFTGAPLPQGADAVIPQEDVRSDGATVVLGRDVKPADFVRPLGEDVRRGEVVLEPGALIGAPEIGLLATLGYSRVRVHRRPRVAILSTGDEIADLGEEPRPGQIPNTNSYSLMAQVIETGAEPLNLGVVRDRLDAIRARLAGGRAADVLISSAGVSVGEHDFVKEAFAELGASMHLWQVSMRPGKPITFGSLGARPVFGLPGNPVSAMVTFELFVRPALRKMSGHRTLTRPVVRGRALAPIANPGSRRGYLRVTLTPSDGAPGVRLTGEQGSGILRSMVHADALAIVPPDTTIATGGDVDVMVLRDTSAT